MSDPVHRPLRYLPLARVAFVLMAVCLVFATSCAHGSSDSISLAQLVNHAAAHDGQVVRASGTVVRFSDTAQSPPYYVLEDAQHDRVLLDPTGGAQRFVGEHLVVEGCFTYSDASGQRLAVTQIVSPKSAHSSTTAQATSCVRSGAPRPTA